MTMTKCEDKKEKSLSSEFLESLSSIVVPYIVLSAEDKRSRLANYF